MVGLLTMCSNLESLDREILQRRKFFSEIHMPDNWPGLLVWYSGFIPDCMNPTILPCNKIYPNDSNFVNDPYSLVILGRFRRNLPIALTFMVRLPENFIIVSPIMTPRPQNHPPFKSL